MNKDSIGFAIRKRPADAGLFYSTGSGKQQKTDERLPFPIPDLISD